MVCTGVPAFISLPYEFHNLFKWLFVMSTSLLPKHYLPSISALHHAAAKKLLLIP